MDYSLKDAFKSLKDVGDNIELKHQKSLKESLEPEPEEINEGYVGQTVEEFLEDCIDVGIIDKIQIADNDADDFTVVFEGYYDDLPRGILEASFDDFDCGDKAVTINADPTGEYSGSTYYETVADFIDDFNGDNIVVVDNNTGDVLFEGDKYDITDEVNEYTFTSFDAPEFICINARGIEKDKDESLHEEENLEEAEDRINLKRYGFVRAPEEDFSDDGNRFTCYYYDPKHEGDKRFRCSKLVSNGDAYINVHYTAPSGRAKYFDDLNGVSISAAVAGIPDLVKELDEFKEKELDAFSVVKKLDDNEVKQIADEIKILMDRAGLSKYAAAERAYHNLGIEYDTVPYEERRKVDNYVRNNSPYDKAQLEGKVKEVIKQVIHDMSSHSRYGYDRKWIDAPAKSIDDAIRTNMGGLSEYPDAVKEKVAKYIKDKLEDLFNFKDESLEEDISEDTIDAIAHEIVDELEEQGLVEQLNESWVNLNDDKEVEEEKEKQEKEKDEAPIEQIVDPSATIVDELRKSYVGYAVLSCCDCKTPIFKAPEELEKTESVNPDTGDTETIYNVGLECVHCGSKNGYDLLGQIATLDAGEPEQKEEPEEEPKEEEQPTEAPKLELPEPEENNEQPGDERDDGFKESLNENLESNLTDFDEVSFDEHINKYLKEVYDNVESYSSTDGSIDGNTVIIEGLIKFNNGKENKTTFKLTLNGTSTISGLNESFAKENNSYSIEGRIENNTFITENINYKYQIEEDLVEGCTKELKEESNMDKIMKALEGVDLGNADNVQEENLDEPEETHDEESEEKIEVEEPLDEKIYSRKFKKQWIADKDGNIVEVRYNGKSIKVGDKVGEDEDGIKADYVTGFDPETNTVWLDEDPNMRDGGRDYSVEDIFGEALDEAKNGNKFEVLWYEGPSEEEAMKGDYQTKEFDNEKDAMDYYNFTKDDEGKYGFWVTERDENWEVVKNLVG